MKKALVILAAYFLSSCGDIGSSKTDINQQTGIGDTPSHCVRECHFTDAGVDSVVMCDGFETQSELFTSNVPQDCVFPDDEEPIEEEE